MTDAATAMSTVSDTVPASTAIAGMAMMTRPSSDTTTVAPANAVARPAVRRGTRSAVCGSSPAASPAWKRETINIE